MLFSRRTYPALLVVAVSVGACTQEAAAPQPGRDAELNSPADSEIVRVLDAGQTPVDAESAPDARPMIDAGSFRDASAATDAAAPLDAATPDTGSAPDSGSSINLDCSAFSSAGHDVCEATPTECRVVFRNRNGGCASVCEAQGFTCAQALRDHDDVNPPLCAPHPSMEDVGCTTAHQSDYCVCTRPGACVPDCTGRQCGGDGCGGSCGTCGADQACGSNGTCVATGAQCRANNPTFSQTQRVSRTIVITQPGVYDYNNVLHIWDGPGSCNQTENQPYILRIASSNVTVRNFAYQNAPDGIHIGTANDGQGHSSGRPITNIVLENVTGWACEDALTTQFGVQNVTIRDSLFLPNPNPQHRDKLLQLNFGNVTVERTTFWGGDELCLMFKGGQNIHVSDSCFNECDRAFNGSTIHGIVGRISRGRSELLSERNEGHHPARARRFWDRWKMYTGEGDVHIEAVGDMLFDNPTTDMEDGATLNVR